MSSEWLQLYTKSFDERDDEVWTNAGLIPHISSQSHSSEDNVLQVSDVNSAASALETVSKVVQDHDIIIPRYIPISTRMDTDLQRGSSSGSTAERASVAIAIDDMDTHTLLMPTMLSNIFRLVRLLSLSSSHIFLPSYFGTSKRAGIALAAKLCNMKMMIFECKGNPCEFEEAVPSDRAIMAGSFKRFLKASILHAIGENYERWL